MQVFKTEKDFPEQIQILGVGLLLPKGQNGIDVEHASKSMTELSKKDKDGKLVKDEQGGLVPLTGKELTAAAKAFAERVDGIELVSIKESEMDKMRAAGELRIDHTAEDTLAAAEMYAKNMSPVITETDFVAGVVGSHEATPEEAIEAVGTDLAGSADDGGGE